MTSQHTPGPWSLLPLKAHGVWAPETGVCIGYAGGRTADEAHANARLIAASPTMLEALRAMLAAFPGPNQTLSGKQHAAWLAALEIVHSIEGG